MAIKILNSDVINQIAAGEVVERPSHLVKELVENSIDAGATQIDVDFAQGGRFVRVSDNGKGIAADELALALARFATSKISQATDLWSLHSFGFRGEALASISSVSRLTLHSNNGSGGYQLISQFGKMSPVDAVARTQGTTIIVEELFENVPARLKFLKSETGEHANIKNVLKSIILANPNIEFRVSQKGDLISFYPAVATLKERVEAVLEIQPLYEGLAQRNDVEATAFFADPNTTAKTARSMWLFAQGRPIQDRGLNAAIMEAYRNLIMHGEFPIAAVFLKTSPENIDVNIHPTKSQVKFAYPQDAFRATQAAIRDVLEKAPWNKTIVQPYVAFSDAVTDASSVSMMGASTFSAPPAPPLNTSFSDPSFFDTKTRQKESLMFQTPMGIEVRNAEPTLTLTDFERAAPESQSNWSQIEILGQANLTYIVGQTAKGVIFVDQHAAHERVAFEKLHSAWRGGKIDVQSFLFPLTVDLSEEKIEALKTKFEDLKRIGIEIEELGPSTLGIKSAPILLKDQVVATELNRLAEEIIEKSDSFLIERVIGDVFARMACHSVVRAGQALSKEEMRSLLVQMDEFPLSTFCPHGRPVYVEYPFYKLEKDFGRIV